MSAPTKPATRDVEQTEPVTIQLPTGNGRSSESGVWMVPATAIVGIATGLAIRVAIPADARFEVVLLLLVLVLAASGAAVVVGRRP